MKTENIIIVGDGGIGSNLSVPLMKFIKYTREKHEIESRLNIKIVDGDFVEKKNFLRQAFLEEDEGIAKSVITAQHLRDLFIISNVFIDGISAYLKENNIKDIIRENSIVLVGVDNYVTRYLIEQHALKLKNILVIFGGNEYDDGDVNVFIREKGKTLTKLYSEKHPEIKKKDKYPDEMGCKEASISVPQLIFANMMVANFMLEAVYSFLSLGKIDWHEKFFCLKTGEVKVVSK